MKKYFRLSFSSESNIFQNKMIKNEKILLFITTLQEAFAAIIPYFLMVSFFKLTLFLVNYTDCGCVSQETLRSLTLTFGIFSSIVAVSAISYFFALRLKISPILSSILSIAVFTSISLFEKNPSTYLVLPNGFNVQTLFSPIVATYLLKYLYPIFSLRIPLNYGHKHVYRLFNYIFAFVIAYFFALLIYVPLDYIGDFFIEHIAHIHLGVPLIIKVIAREISIQIFWFFGIHGEHIANALFTKNLLFKYIFPNLTVAEFIRLFVNIGGSGVGIAMFFALMLYMKDRPIRVIAKISIPFLPFNINTLLIYAVVVLNRFLLIPFILLPLINAAVAYLFLSFSHIVFLRHYIVWTTPFILNAYIKSGGNLYVVFLQVFLIVIDTLIYSYFVRKFSNSTDLMSAFQILEKNLDITTELRAKEVVQTFKARSEIIEASAKLEETLNSLTKNNLFVYYQPKIDIKNCKCNEIEALIRYDNNGRLTGPVFLGVIEEAGLAPVIDIWVCKKVKKHLEEWKKDGFKPVIGVNLHPDTLADREAVSKIIKILRENNVMFEIIERSFVKKEAKENLEKIKEEGFKISIDDYGTGYSNLESVINLDIDEIKIDKSLIDEIETGRGFVVCKYITDLCHELNIKVVAEGVEKEGQLRAVKSIGVDIVQGYYFSPAISKNEIIAFCGKF